MTKKKPHAPHASDQDVRARSPETSPPPVASEQEMERTKGARAGGATSTANASRLVRSGRLHADNDELTPDQRHAVETPEKPPHGRSKTRDHAQHVPP